VQGSNSSGVSAAKNTTVTTASPFSTETATNLSGTSTSAFAMATHVPAIAGMGVLGFLGVIALL